MSKTDLIYPEEGELVVVTVHSVKQNGADVSLDEYEGVDGFIFIGEIASGWIKNIRRFVREGQRGVQSHAKSPRWQFPKAIIEVGFRGAAT